MYTLVYILYLINLRPYNLELPLLYLILSYYTKILFGITLVIYTSAQPAGYILY